MPTKINWETPAAIQTYLSTELNSLADGANKLGAEIDFTATEPLYLVLELYLAAQASARSSGAYVAIYLLSSVDGTNYGYGDDSLDPPASALLAILPLDASTSARYVTECNILIPPLKGKLLAINETGQALASSGNTLKYRTHSHESQ